MSVLIAYLILEILEIKERKSALNENKGFKRGKENTIEMDCPWVFFLMNMATKFYQGVSF